MKTRVIIEMATVRLAVMRADEAALAELKENVRKQKEAIRNRNVEAFIKHDVEFHFSLARATGNKVLVQFLGAVAADKRANLAGDTNKANSSRFTRDVGRIK